MPAISSMSIPMNLDTGFESTTSANYPLQVTNISNSLTPFSRSERSAKEVAQGHDLAYRAHLPKVRNQNSESSLRKLTESQKKVMALELRKDIKTSAKSHCKTVEKIYERLQVLGRKGEHQIKKVQIDKDYCDDLKKLHQSRIQIQTTSSSPLENYTNIFRDPCSIGHAYSGSVTDFIMKIIVCNRSPK